MGFETQVAANNGVETLLAEVQRGLVNRVVHIARLDHGLERDIAEHRKFLPHFEVERHFGAANEHLGLDADLAELRDALLGWLGLEFPRRLDERHKRHMHDDRVVVADLENELADGFQKRQSLDVAGRAADFGDQHIGAGILRDGANAVFDLIGDVRNHLHGLAEVVPAAFLHQHGFVDLAAREVVFPRQHAMGETLVMPEVEIRLGAVRQHIHLAVLEGAHRAGIDIQIGVEFLEGHLESAPLQKRAERRRREAFSK